MIGFFTPERARALMICPGSDSRCRRDCPRRSRALPIPPKGIRTSGRPKASDKAEAKVVLPVPTRPTRKTMGARAVPMFLSSLNLRTDIYSKILSLTSGIP